MWKALHSGLTSVAVLLVSFVACAPRTSPTPTMSPAPIPRPLATPVATTPVISPDDAKWQQVIRAAQQEGKVIIYAPVGLVGEPGRVVADAFRAKYDVSLEILVLTMPAITEKLQMEAKQGQQVGDIAISGSVSAPRLVLLGLGEDVSRDLPVLRNRESFAVPPVFSPEGQVLTYGYAPFALQVNSKLVNKGEIQSYYDLLDSKWKGNKIILSDPRLGSNGPMLVISQFRTDKILDDAYFQRLGEQNPFLFGGSTIEQVNMVARGEFPIGFDQSYPNALSALREGAPIRLLHLKEGTIGMPNTIMAVKNSPHPNATRLFLNWFLSAEGQNIFHKVDVSASIRNDVPDFTHPGALEDPIKKLLPTTWDDSLKAINEVNAGVMEKFFGKR